MTKCRLGELPDLGGVPKLHGLQETSQLFLRVRPNGRKASRLAAARFRSLYIAVPGDAVL